MDIRLLETFSAVVRHHSATRAAAELGVTQPAVSVQIARLEKKIGFELFARANGRMRPTPEGLVFHAEVSKALDSIERLAQSARNIRSGQIGTLIVAGHPSASISLLPGIVARFSSARPGVVIRMITRHSNVLSQMVPAESFDIGIAELPLDEAAVRLRRFRMRCVAILPAGNLLACHARLTPGLLSGQPWVATSAAHQAALQIRNAFQDAKAEWNVVADTEMFASTCGLVASGMGCAIVDPLSASLFCTSGLEIRPFEPEISYDIGVFYARERELSTLAAAFLEDLYAALQPYTFSGDR